MNRAIFSSSSNTSPNLRKLRSGPTWPPGSTGPERTPHSLRHIYASLHIAKLEAGRDRDGILTYVRSQLRHRNIQTTMDDYTTTPDRHGFQFSGTGRAKSNPVPDRPETVSAGRTVPVKELHDVTEKSVTVYSSPT
jgi:hypothetical protein